MRVGLGFDVHPFAEGRRLILGGVEIPYEKGLDGHSDADVLTHAVMDAILGAAGLGDIGDHFPPSEAKYKDISSMLLLDRVMSLLKEKGYCVLNLDCVIMAEDPKVAPYRSKIKASLAQQIGLAEDMINIKATTTEGLGFIGRKEGIAAQTVCLIDNYSADDCSVGGTI